MRALDPTRLTALLALLGLAPGCGVLGNLGLIQVTQTPQQRFEPAGPRAFQTDTAAAQLNSVLVDAADGGAVVSVTVTAHEAALLEGATLSSAAAAPCAAGVSAHAVALGGQLRWDRPVGFKGSASVVLTFSDATALLGEPGAVVDLRLAGAAKERCLRVPLGAAGDETAMLPAPPWRAGGAVRTTFALERGFSQFLGGAIRGSYWFSRGLVGVEGGLALMSCVHPCGVVPQYQVPLWLLAGAIPVRVRGFGLGVELAYGVIPGISRRDSDPTIVMHGPRVTLHLLEVTPRLAATTRSMAAARGLELSLSYQRPWVGPAPEALVFGVGVVAF